MNDCIGANYSGMVQRVECAGGGGGGYGGTEVTVAYGGNGKDAPSKQALWKWALQIFHDVGMMQDDEALSMLLDDTAERSYHWAAVFEATIIACASRLNPTRRQTLAMVDVSDAPSETQPGEGETMICNLYEVAIVKDTITNAASGEKKTDILVPPTVVLAIGAQAARDKAVRLLTEEQASDLDATRIFIREFSSTYSAGWNK